MGDLREHFTSITLFTFYLKKINKFRSFTVSIYFKDRFRFPCPVQVDQLFRASSQNTKFAGSVPGQGTYKK